MIIIPQFFQTSQEAFKFMVHLHHIDFWISLKNLPLTLILRVYTLQFCSLRSSYWVFTILFVLSQPSYFHFLFYFASLLDIIYALRFPWSLYYSIYNFTTDSPVCFPKDARVTTWMSSSSHYDPEVPHLANDGCC